MKIIVIIPAYNAEKTIEDVFERIPKNAYEKISEFIIVNDGSKDKTEKVVKELKKKYTKIKLINHEKNRGYGGAQKTGYKEALKDGGEIMVLLHSDGQYAPELLLDMVKPIENGIADIVGGSRFLGGQMKQNMPLIRYYGNRFLTKLENLIFNMNITTYHSGYKTYSKKALELIPFERYSNNFCFDSEILVGAKKNNLRIEEIPIPTKYADEKSYLNPITYGLTILKVLFRYITNPIYYYKTFNDFFKYKTYVKFKNVTCNYLHRKWYIRKEINNFNGIILDIGSGISPIAEINEKSIFGDISPIAVEILRNQGANSRILDITNLDLKDNSIDMVVCSEVLEHISNYKKALKEIKRVLKKDGILILTAPIYKYYWLKDDELVGHLRRYEPEELIKELEEVGFHILKKKMIGSLTERLTTYFITTTFLLGNKESKYIIKFFWLYKILNIIWAYVLILTSKITHPKLSTLLLIKCRKK